jgi:Cu2+-exporting ATPase
MFRDKFWFSLAMTIPALVWDPMLQSWLGYTAPRFPGSRFIPAVFGTAVFVYGGWVFIHGALRELADRLPGMMTLISLAITVAFVYSAAVTFGFPGHPLWMEVATLITIMLLGHWIEMRSIFQAQGASPCAYPSSSTCDPIRSRPRTMKAWTTNAGVSSTCSRWCRPRSMSGSS